MSVLICSTCLERPVLAPVSSPCRSVQTSQNITVLYTDAACVGRGHHGRPRRPGRVAGLCRAADAAGAGPLPAPRPGPALRGAAHAEQLPRGRRARLHPHGAACLACPLADPRSWTWSGRRTAQTHSMLLSFQRCEHLMMSTLTTTVCACAGAVPGAVLEAAPGGVQPLPAAVQPAAGEAPLKSEPISKAWVSGQHVHAGHWLRRRQQHSARAFTRALKLVRCLADHGDVDTGFLPFTTSFLRLSPCVIRFSPVITT